MAIKITKQLATMEDLAIGTGTVVQERNGVPLTLTKIDFVPKSEVVIRVISVADMKALSALSGAAILTLGYYSASDGGHGIYDILEENEANNIGKTSDGAVNHTLDNGNIAVLRVNGKTVLAGQAGIFGTETTYASTNTYKTTTYNVVKWTNNNDVSQQVAAILNLGYNINFQAGNYYFGSPADFVANNSIVYSDSGAAIIGDGFRVKGASDGFEMYGLTFLGLFVNPIPPLPLTTNASYENDPNYTWYLDYAEIGFGTNALGSTQMSIIEFSNISMHDCFVAGRSSGMAFSATTSGINKNIKFFNNTTNGIWQHGCGVRYCDRILVTNNIFHRHFVGMAYNHSGYSVDALVSGNIGTKLPQFFKSVYSDESTVSNLKVTNNYFSTWEAGEENHLSSIMFELSGTENTVTDNYFEFNASLSENSNYAADVLILSDGSYNVIQQNNIKINSLVGLNKLLQQSGGVEDYTTLFLNNTINIPTGVLPTLLRFSRSSDDYRNMKEINVSDNTVVGKVGNFIQLIKGSTSTPSTIKKLHISNNSLSGKTLISMHSLNGLSFDVLTISGNIAENIGSGVSGVSFIRLIGGNYNKTLNIFDNLIKLGVGITEDSDIVELKPSRVSTGTATLSGNVFTTNKEVLNTFSWDPGTGLELPVTVVNNIFELVGSIVDSRVGIFAIDSDQYVSGNNTILNRSESGNTFFERTKADSATLVVSPPVVLGDYSRVVT